MSGIPSAPSTPSTSSSPLSSDKDSKWYFSAEQLRNSPSRHCGMDIDAELSQRQQTAYLIQEMGQRLQVSQLCINTAIVYMHRFYAFHSFTQFHRNGIASGSLFLAAKVEEQPRKLEHVIRAANKCLGIQSTPVTDAAYIEQAQDLVFNENVLLQTLGFDVAIDHPHTHVVKTCNLVKACKDLAQTSYFLASNSLHLTSMCLQYRPTVVACFCIYLACKWSRWEIPQSTEGKHWFHYVDRTVTMDLLKQLTEEFIAIYEKSPARLKSKLNNIKAIAQGASGRVGINKDKKHSDDWMKGYHSNITTNDTTSYNSDHVQTVHSSLRKAEMHSSQHRSHHSGSTHHPKMGFPPTNDVIDHKTGHKQQSYGGSSNRPRDYSQQPQGHQSMMQQSSSNSMRSSSSTSSSAAPRVSMPGQSSSSTSSQARQMDANYHKSRDSRNSLPNQSHAGLIQPPQPPQSSLSHSAHKLSSSSTNQNKDSRTSSSASSLSLKESNMRMSTTDPNKQSNTKIYSSSSMANIPPYAGNSSNMHSQRPYQENNVPIGFHQTQLSRQNPNNNNSNSSSSNNLNKHDQSKAISVHMQQQQQQKQNESLFNTSGINHDHLSHTSNSSGYGSSDQQSIASTTTATTTTMQPPMKSSAAGSAASASSIFNADFQSTTTANYNNGNTNDMNYQLNAPTKERNNRGIGYHGDNINTTTMLPPPISSSSSSTSRLLGNQQSQQQMKSVNQKTINEQLAGSSLGTGNTSSTATGLKRPNESVVIKQEQDDNILLRDNKIRKIDNYSNSTSTTSLSYLDTKPHLSDLNKIQTGIETNADLVRNLLKESLCTSKSALIKPDSLTPPSLQPPAELLDTSTTSTSATTIQLSNVLNEPPPSINVGLNITELSAAGSGTGSVAASTITGTESSGKKKKKDKHKHKEKDKTKDREERKKHKKDKDKHKDRESSDSKDGGGGGSGGVSSNKLKNEGGIGVVQSNGLKIKIRDPFAGKDNNTSATSNTSISEQQSNPSAIKIKICNYKVESYTGGGGGDGGGGGIGGVGSGNQHKDQQNSGQSTTMLRINTGQNINYPLYAQSGNSNNNNGGGGGGNGIDIMHINKKKDHHHHHREKNESKKRASDLSKTNGNSGGVNIGGIGSAAMLDMPEALLNYNVLQTVQHQQQQLHHQQQQQKNQNSNKPMFHSDTF